MPSNPRLQRTRSALLRSPLSRKPLGVTRELAGGFQPLAICTLTIWLMVGCTVQQTASVDQVDSNQEVMLTRTWAGILLGPCSTPYAGKEEGYSWLKLSGAGPVYSADEIQIVTQDGKPDSWWPGKVEGEVRVDQSGKRVVVTLHVGGKSFWMNGTFHIREAG